MKMNSTNLGEQSTWFDLYRITGKITVASYIKTFLSCRHFRQIVYFRKLQNAKGIKQIVYRFLNHFILNKTSIDIPLSVKIGRGLLLIHPYSIAINDQAIIGDNLTMLKGSTIGNSKTGNKGVPVICNNVYIGLNSTVVGNVRIGDNVLIAANTFVNCDVPNGSLVIGSPGVIHERENASLAYITNNIYELLK